MPIYENVCRNEGCEKYGKVFEWYAPRHDSANPLCQCGQTTCRCISPFQVVFTGALTAKYNDPKLEHAHQEGHWAYRVRSSRNADGSPEPVFIDTFEKQKEFCRDEGLINPKDVGPMHISSDGKQVQNQGLPGCWV